MKPLLTRAIVLSRTDFGEADRIITVLTPDHGKLRLMAKGVRKPKSKLAGGIELFSTSEITYIKGRGEIDTLISARLTKHYGNIIKDIIRVQLGYELIKTLHRATEDQLEDEYYELLETGFRALDNNEISADLIKLWFTAQLLRYSGHMLNLTTDVSGSKLEAKKTYVFDFDSMSFNPHPEGNFAADHIKFLRLVFSGSSPQLLNQIKRREELMQATLPLIISSQHNYLRS